MKNNVKKHGAPKCGDLHFTLRWYMFLDTGENFGPVVGFHSHFGKHDTKYFFVEEY